MVQLAPSADPNLDTIVREIERVSRPELVLLFGSRARGDHSVDSDYDLMLVVDDGCDVLATERACADALRRAGLIADVVARTTSQYAQQQHDPGFLPWLVSREGR